MFCLEVFPLFGFQGVALFNKLSVSTKNLVLLGDSLKAGVDWLTPIYQDFRDKQP